MKLHTLAICLTCAVLAFNTTACSRQDSRLEQHKKTFESLGATTAAIAEGWLNGQVSGTYARTAFQKVFELVEQERRALTKEPEALQDPRGASLSQDAEQLSRLLAAMMLDITAADATSVRQHVAEIPVKPQEQR
jgi:hypothetical protein